MVTHFLEAQDNGVYERALSEIKSGQKKSHWMWFIFPQIRGLGYSYTAKYYALQDRAQAEEYLNNPILKERLIEISQAVYDLNAESIADVFGYPDYLKFKSSMTLFTQVAPNIPVFTQNLQRYFNGDTCGHTKSML